MWFSYPRIKCVYICKLIRSHWKHPVPPTVCLCLHMYKRFYSHSRFLHGSLKAVYPRIFWLLLFTLDVRVYLFQRPPSASSVLHTMWQIWTARYLLSPAWRQQIDINKKDYKDHLSVWSLANWTSCCNLFLFGWHDRATALAIWHDCHKSKLQQLFEYNYSLLYTADMSLQLLCMCFCVYGRIKDPMIL